MSPMLSPQGVADRFGVDRRSVYRWLEAGQLRGLRVGGLWRIAESDLAAFVVPTAPRRRADVDHVAAFSANAKTFTRWAHEIHDAAIAAATCAGERDPAPLVAVMAAADTLLDALGDWQTPLALYVHTTCADWILLTEGSMLAVDRQVFADFLTVPENQFPILEIWQGTEDWTEVDADMARAADIIGSIVAGYYGGRLVVEDAELWQERQAFYGVTA